MEEDANKVLLPMAPPSGSVISLNMLLDFAVQRIFHEITVLSELWVYFKFNIIYILCNTYVFFQQNVRNIEFELITILCFQAPEKAGCWSQNQFSTVCPFHSYVICKAISSGQVGEVIKEVWSMFGKSLIYFQFLFYFRVFATYWTCNLNISSKQLIDL